MYVYLYHHIYEIMPALYHQIYTVCPNEIRKVSRSREIRGFTHYYADPHGDGSQFLSKVAIGGNVVDWAPTAVR